MNGIRFTILTTAANHSMEGIHSRVPLTIEPAEIHPWILENDTAELILRKRPKELEKEIVGQMSLFD